ncbi:hypothetical protein DDF67_04515 [Caulobacter endophyticus]|uniref:Uncharacterized protein n=1 Tax=Caulobacter endophyticus TaxID=2172652 RepID=A0A2T9KAQ5_9CAUL|nr:hypothetical protein DDF67_04515 [Caulobacter endophyticus]
MLAAAADVLSASGTSPSGPSGHLPLQGEDLWARLRSLPRDGALVRGGAERPGGARRPCVCLAFRLRRPLRRIICLGGARGAGDVSTQGPAFPPDGQDQ